MTAGLNFASAENDTMIMSTESEEESKIKSEEERTGDIVGASEDGHFNISFDDGYSGYCINYGKPEATEGDKFTVQDTSEAVNHKSKESISNELKTFFVEYFDVAMEDKIKTQHIIWHFSDDFTGWRVDPNLIEEIKKTSNEKAIPDHGAVKKINNTTEAVFDFEVLKSTNPGYQDYFAYKIIFRDILENIEEELVQNNTSLKNESDKNISGENKTNITSPTDDTAKNETQKKISEPDLTIQESKDSTINDVQNDEKEENRVKGNLKKHVTGYNFIPALIILLFGIIVIVKYTRD